MGGENKGEDKPNQIVWVGRRIALAIAAALAVAGLPAALVIAADRTELSGALNLMGVGFLIMLPFCLGAILSLFLDLRGKRSMRFHAFVNVGLILTTIIVGGFILREGIICIVLLVPLWGAVSFMGSMLVYHFHSVFASRFNLNCSLLLAIPVFAMFAEPDFLRVDEFTVTRTVQIGASSEEVWPYLISLESISDNEGEWNLTQDVLGVPRPRSAKVIGEGVGARRLAAWSSDITFEEHIVSMTPGNELKWRFVFPNDSIQHRIDRHIAPQGEHLQILTGAYELRELGPKKTELRLNTTYLVQTPVNHYAALWGELMLGDIQSNILHVIKQRVEGE